MDATAPGTTWTLGASLIAGRAKSTVTLFGTTAGVESSNVVPVTVGVRFKTSQAGYVTGVRFHKLATATGVHTGALWRNDGTLLASVVFSGESASGWQEAAFATPVALQPDVPYVIGVHTSDGKFTVEDGYFTDADHVAGILTAPMASVSSPNGVFVYGEALAFPDSTDFGNDRYDVDVIFEPGGVARGVTWTLQAMLSINATAPGHTFELTSSLIPGEATNATHATAPGATWLVGASLHTGLARGNVNVGPGQLRAVPERIYADATSLVVFQGPANVAVNWSIHLGSGTLEPLSDATDARGLAAALYRAAGSPGTAIVRCRYGT